MATKPVKILPISEETFLKFRNSKTNSTIDSVAKNIEQKFSALCTEFAQKFAADKWILMKRINTAQDVYYIHDIAGLMPNLNSFGCATVPEYDHYNISQNRWNFAEFTGDLPTETEMNRCFHDRFKYFRNDYGAVCGCRGVTFKKNNEFWYKYFYNNRFKNTVRRHGERTDGDSMLSVPIYRFNGINSVIISPAQAILYWMKYDLEPFEEEFRDKAGRESYKELQKFYRKYGEYLQPTDNGIISLNIKKISQAILNGKEFDFIPDAKNFIENKNIEVNEEFIKALEKEFLECDTRRAALSPYGRNLLYGPNEGHWDLWDYNFQSEYKIDLKESFTARDPATDISRGIVGIDFGTKSTVVVCESANHQRLPVQVGSGDYTHGINAANYENPTVMQFINFEKFLADYESRAGRPNTEWNDITVSHNAFENLNHAASKNYYSFFEGLKHWCGTPDEEIKIRDNQGREWNLPAFLKLEDNQPNPIEIYAYYLGLYINNMIRGEIILSYIMSFPVTYDFSIREKIRASFEKGIKKSLPTALLSNAEAMKNFYVVHGASEPAAYAVSALLEYNFDPSGDEENYYGVFDFGGGTTDFDFGVFKESDRQRYDYELKHFGANGDKTLGGENLLKLLAFEVFKANINKLIRPNKENADAPIIPFTYAAEREKFLNSESVINETSQEAKANMHNLMESLRAVWENPDSEESKKICESDITVSLFDESGNNVSGFTLDIVQVGDNSDKKIVDLKKILRDRIEKGVRNFFYSLKQAFESPAAQRNFIKPLSEIGEFEIFLAGNSSKSELVKEIFEEYIGEQFKAGEIIGIEKNSVVFRLYPPLGTNEAMEIQKLRGVEISEDKFEQMKQPTGKTGVAFGLLSCRESGQIEVSDILADEESGETFQLYIGRQKKGKFKTLIDRTAKMFEWHEFLDDASASFDILYTDVPEAATNNASVSISKQYPIKLEQTNAEAKIFIRPVAPYAIEYAIALDEYDLAEKNYIIEPVRIDLK